jgi:hypothetical protein
MPYAGIRAFDARAGPMEASLGLSIQGHSLRDAANGCSLHDAASSSGTDKKDLTDVPTRRFQDLSITVPLCR